MAKASRVVLEVGDYSNGVHFAVIGSPIEFYLWYKPKGQKGHNSNWFTGRQAFLHYNKMRELLNINKNKEAFAMYLSDLYCTNPDHVIKPWPIKRA